MVIFHSYVKLPEGNLFFSSLVSFDCVHLGWHGVFFRLLETPTDAPNETPNLSHWVVFYHLWQYHKLLPPRQLWFIGKYWGYIMIYLLYT